MGSPKNVAISVKDLHKSFRLPKEHSNELKRVFINFVRGIKGYSEQKVLKGLSFDIEEGDFVGIVGRNGSGKSTLLKILAGVYSPDKGSVKINGSLVPFIELGVGFNPELTGRENIYMNGAMLGLSNQEVDKIYDEIVDFAELHDFMDQKLKNYSSGMQVRLAFSIAIRAEADILLLDEVLAVGDEAFQKKCNDYFEKIRKDKGKTVILVTHSMEAVRQYCNKAVFIKDGQIVASGSPDDIADKYSLENLRSVSCGESGVNAGMPIIAAKIKGSLIIKNKDKVKIEVRYRNTDDRPVYIKVVIKYRDVGLLFANAKLSHGLVTQDLKEHVVQYELPLSTFNQGEFTVVALLVDSEREINIASFGYNKEVIFKIKDAVTGEKIGGAMKDSGKMEMIQ
ncbi:ABC transporter ATP-binding protein [Candidatus Saccharibacteria bacterium]|nr:ABC transporter ATP-binding protein [Candidatus Saccharibacteria bacterium]